MVAGALGHQPAHAELNGQVGNRKLFAFAGVPWKYTTAGPASSPASAHNIPLRARRSRIIGAQRDSCQQNTATSVPVPACPGFGA